MRVAAFVTFFYAMCLADGGIIGYVKAKSLPSLISGLASGAIGVLAGVLIWQQHVVGQCLAGTLALALAVFGAKAWLAEGKPFMPRGAICVLSLGELAALLAFRH